MANGNTGDLGSETVGSPATAKNVISVGSTFNTKQSWLETKEEYWVEEGGCPGPTVDGLDNHHLAYFSSRGPTDDGRQKPDILAPGSPIVSARAGSPDGYMVRHGTSMSAPLVAGIVANSGTPFPICPRPWPKPS